MIEPRRSPDENKSFFTVEMSGHTLGTQYNFESEEEATLVIESKNKNLKKKIYDYLFKIKQWKTYW